MNEQMMHKIVTEHVNELGLLRLAEDKYSRYDAEHNRCIVEYKSRNKFWKTTMIERDKLQANLDIAKEKGKAFLYIVFDGYDKIQIFNIGKLVEDGYDFDWKVRSCPATSECKDNPMNGIYIDKQIGEIAWDKAIRTVHLKRKDDVKKRDVKAGNEAKTGFNYDNVDF